MTELESLIAERNRIQSRINELKRTSWTYGRAKLDMEHFVTDRPDEWFVAVQRILDIDSPYNNEMRRFSIIRATSRDAAIGHIDEMVSDLLGLKELYEKGRA